jgi:hypothetical protein
MEKFKKEQRKIHTFKPKLSVNTVKIILSKKKEKKVISETLRPILNLIENNQQDS